MSEPENEQKILKCGVIMPISAMEGCTEAHWSDVRGILFDVIEEQDLDPLLVSDSDDVGVIHKRIIQNIYENPIVVCDVSGKNANVMFELGMRLAFDKPTVIVKDDQTDYSFDTSPIEHLEYPRDLRFGRILEFKQDLAAKLAATLRASKTDENFTTFLQHFGTFQTAQLDSEEVSSSELILSELQEMRHSMRILRNREVHGGGISRSVLSEPILAGLTSIRAAIRDFARENRIRSKTRMRDEFPRLEEFVEREIHPSKYFKRREDFKRAFELIFTTMY